MRFLSRLLDVGIGLLLIAFGLRFITHERPFQFLDALSVLWS